MNEPLFVYLPIYHWPDGSCYKYYKLLRNEYGGIWLQSKNAVAKPSDFKPSFARFKPQLAFCHGDWMSYYRVPMAFKVPYVLFEHDIHSLRSELTEIQTRQEKEMIYNAAGIIFTSEDHQAYIQKKYPGLTDNQGIVYLRPLKSDICFNPLPKLKGKHLVYAGGIVSYGAKGSKFGYRSYFDIFKAFQDAGWTIHVFGNKTHAATLCSYSRAGYEAHPWVPYPELLKCMSQFTAGLQAYADTAEKKAYAYTQTCRPNKVWDYLAAGIPTIGLNAGNCAKIYVDGGWGVTVPDTKKETLQNIELPEIDQKNRYDQVMENDIPVFERVINIALKDGSVKKIDTIKIKTKNRKEVSKMDMKDWHIVKETIFENGKLLYGRGRRITKSEAIRLGIVKKESDLKKKLEDRAEKREGQKKAEVEVAEVAIRTEVKPLDPAELKVEQDKIINNYLKEHPEKEAKRGRGRKSKHHK